MALKVENLDDVRVVTLEGRLVTEVAQNLFAEFNEYVEGSPGTTLLDMTGVRYMGSFLVGVLVNLRTGLSKRGFALHVAGLESRNRLVLRVAGLEGLFDFHLTREEGLASLGATTQSSQEA